MFTRIWSTFVARNKEFYRDRAALAWSLIFPTLLVLAFSFAFDGGDQAQYKVGILNPSEAWDIAEKAFLSTRFVDFVEYQELEQAQKKLEFHSIDLLVDFAEKNYFVNLESPNGYLVERIFISFLGQGAFDKQTITTAGIRYVDWVFPGIIAMNMMFGALYGLGYVLVNYRKNGVLRRFKATPINTFEFLLAQILSRLLVVLATSGIVFWGCYWLIGFQMQGSFLDLLLIFALGSTCMIAMGMIVACRTTSKEFADGVLNMIAWPMMLGSGVWFSLEGTNPLLQQVAQFFPLTHIVDAMRAIMTEGTPLSALGYNVVALAGATVVFLLIGIGSFRWENS